MPRGMGGISRGWRIWVFAWTGIKIYWFWSDRWPFTLSSFCCVHFQSHQLACVCVCLRIQFVVAWKHLDRTAGCSLVRNSRIRGIPSVPFVLFTQLYLPLGKKFSRLLFIYCLQIVIELLSHCRSFAYFQTYVPLLSEKRTKFRLLV